VRQATALSDALATFVIDRILSSPTKRCRDTVAPLAAARGMSVNPSKRLREGTGAAAAALVIGSEHDQVLCTHGDVVEAILRALRKAGWPIPARPRHAKGSTWVLRRGGDCEYLPPRA
jgi:broad specificity phosphatase PhoE